MSAGSPSSLHQKIPRDGLDMCPCARTFQRTSCYHQNISLFWLEPEKPQTVCLLHGQPAALSPTHPHPSPNYTLSSLILAIGSSVPMETLTLEKNPFFPFYLFSLRNLSAFPGQPRTSSTPESLPAPRPLRRGAHVARLWAGHPLVLSSDPRAKL